MRILFVYPHPDDESFGPASVMSKYAREGHEVHLLTLTRGGATRQRHRLNLSVEEMGKVRYEEMLEVAGVLHFTDMTVLDLPDSGLKEMDPRDIERVVEEHIRRVEPHVVVTYPVHGISGFHDHLVSHAVVKRVFLEIKNEVANLQRLAFPTLTEEHAARSRHFSLSGSTPEEIDCVVTVTEEDLEANRRALDCYRTFKETIDKTGIKTRLTKESHFELFQERHDPPLDDLFAGLV